ncbi:HIRAN domain-containing protein [Bacillus fonticola]|uniref:HIRAN domain-containing protein n=1 Tax=Bacillus fonticola TaxID=2728853 RepID=UPI001472DCF3|nr:HIRAN domain-containing protein [Bacillus fonticola]
MAELLWLVWQNIETRQKYHVGNLLYIENDGYYFEYEKQQKSRGLSEALLTGFKGFLAFPDFKSAYYSPFLFHAFERRLPNKNRPDYQQLMKHFGLESNAHQMELLRVTKGKTATDSFELVSPISVDGKGFVLDFYIEGWRYYDGDKVLDQLSVNEALAFKREPDNEHDVFAVKVLASGCLIGYVPAVYSEFFTGIIDHDGELTMVVSKISYEAIPQMKVLVHVTGCMPQSLDEQILIKMSPVQERMDVIEVVQ